MNKLTALLALSSTHVTDSALRGGKDDHYTKTIVITAAAECSGESILPLVQGNPHFHRLTKDEIDGLCHQENHHRSLQDTQEEVPFSYVSALGRQFDKNYFDGGTDWNVGTDKASSSKEVNAGRIAAVKDALSTKQLKWPSHIVNFDDNNSCQLRTAMCCFTKGQDPSTGQVSNINDVPSWVAPNIVPNADVCMVHLDRSPQAGHVKNGKTIYSDGRDTEEGTSDAYCTGFTWNSDENDLSTKYRANTLYHISMLNGFYNNDLVGGVPGAPMCGCVEQMPIVSDSECVKPVQSRVLTVSNDNEQNRRLQITTSIDFVPCGQSLVEEYGAIDPANDVDALSEIIAGDCADAVDDYLAPQAYKRGRAWWFADEEQWIPVFGTKFLYHPEMSAENVQKTFEQSSTKTIRRVCLNCSPSHRDIYYKRLTDVPDSLNLLNMMKDNFSSANNILGTDFTMYSKDKDGSVSSNWTFCSYSTSHGFPYECGPTAATPMQWSSSTRQSRYANDYAFYIEK